MHSPFSIQHSAFTIRPVERISSRQNAIVKRFRELAHSRQSDGAALLDGVHLLEEALATGVKLEAIAFSDAVLDGHLRELANQASRAGIRTIAVTPQVLSAMSPVRNPSGVVAIAQISPAPLAAVLRSTPQLIVVLHEVQDPGNVGATIRVAESFGASGLITTPATANPFGWKALRGAMGSAFRLPIATDVPIGDVRAALKAARIPLVATVPREGTPLPSANLRGPAAILLGGEGGGLSEELIRSADTRVTIPMHAQTESLNVAVAGAIVLYEASRQRVGS